MHCKDKFISNISKMQVNKKIRKIVNDKKKNQKKTLKTWASSKKKKKK